MTTFKEEFLKAAKETPRLFFAPLIGAVEAVRREFKAISAGDQEKYERYLASLARRPLTSYEWRQALGIKAPSQEFNQTLSELLDREAVLREPIEGSHVYRYRLPN
jgi:hypothetical protein